MERHIPRPGEKYLHFKGKQYQILCVAEHSETKEPLVVYQALYGDFTCYARPLEMFMEEVDHRKYPEAMQKYRFELSETKGKSTWDGTKEESCNCEITVEDKIDEDKTDEDAANTEERADPALLQFLDADTLEQKYQVLKLLEGSITDRLIDDFAVALDLVIPEGSLDNRYFQLLSSVRTMQRFENNRFR